MSAASGIEEHDRSVDIWHRALLRHEQRVQRLESRVDARTRDDAKAQVSSRASL